MPQSSRSGRRWFATVFGLTTAVGLLQFLYKYLEFATRGAAIQPLRPLVEELTGAWGAGLLLTPVIWLARRYPVDRAGWLRHVLPHLAGAAAFAVAHTTFMWAARAVLFPLLGMGAYDYGAMPLRYAMEAPIQLLVYTLIVAFTHLFDRHHAGRQRELHASRLEAQLARAQLQNLQAQLHPHFLYNALNTISSVMYENLAAADQLLARLSDLLRRALQASHVAEVPLAAELETLELYLDLMRARFGERLQAKVAVDAELAGALVPPFLLQPLVENAAHHGAPPPPEPLRIEIRAVRRGERLCIEVEDNGPGIPAGRSVLGEGIGLTNTAERLTASYGDRQALTWRNLPAGGLVVAVELPFHEQAGRAEPAPEEERWTASAR